MIACWKESPHTKIRALLSVQVFADVANADEIRFMQAF